MGKGGEGTNRTGSGTRESKEDTGAGPEGVSSGLLGREWQKGALELRAQLCKD